MCMEAAEQMNEWTNEPMKEQRNIYEGVKMNQLSGSELEEIYCPENLEEEATFCAQTGTKGIYHTLFSHFLP